MPVCRTPSGSLERLPADTPVLVVMLGEGPEGYAAPGDPAAGSHAASAGKRRDETPFGNQVSECVPSLTKRRLPVTRRRVLR